MADKWIEDAIRALVCGPRFMDALNARRAALLQRLVEWGDIR
jgi:hypothetical protein